MAMGVSLNRAGDIPVPEDLGAAIQEARASLEAHKAARPANLDVVALGKWSEAKDRLKFNLDFLEGIRRTAWKDATPGAKPAQDAGARPYTPYVTPHPYPRPKIVRPRIHAPRPKGTTRKTPAQKLETAMAKHVSLLGALETVPPPSRERTSAIRQQIFALRTDIKAACAAGNLPLPVLAPIPNPWASR